MVKDWTAQEDIPLKFGKIPFDKLTWLTAGDSAWANNEDWKTQGGYVTVAVNCECLTGKRTVANIANWASHKLSRVTPSSLDGEAISMNVAVGENEFQMQYWNELTTADWTVKVLKDFKPRLPGIITTDSKSLWDLVKNGHGLPESKRTALEVIAIRETARAGHTVFRWIPGDKMIADALTKDAPIAKAPLQELMKTGKLALVEQPVEGFVERVWCVSQLYRVNCLNYARTHSSGLVLTDADPRRRRCLSGSSSVVEPRGLPADFCVEHSRGYSTYGVRS
jgi:hypothetical protein